MNLTSVPEAVTEPAAGAESAPARNGPPMVKRLAHGLAFDRVGAVYVWLGIIVLFSLWVPETFPNLATAKQILNANAITALALANAPQWAGDMFVGVVLIASLALTGLQRRSTAGRRTAG